MPGQYYTRGQQRQGKVVAEEDRAAEMETTIGTRPRRTGHKKGNKLGCVDGKATTGGFEKVWRFRSRPGRDRVRCPAGVKLPNGENHMV